MLDETAPIVEDPGLCVKCDKPFVPDNMAFGIPIVCPRCFIDIATARMMEWHALRYEADEHIRRYIALIQGASIALPNYDSESTSTKPFPLCKHQVELTACWKCRQNYQGGGQTDGRQIAARPAAVEL